MIWGVIHITYRFLIWMMLALMLLQIVGRFKMERLPSVNDEGWIELGPNWFAIFFLALTLPLFLLSAADHRHHGTNLWTNPLPICFGLWLLAIVSDFPATVIVSSDGLRQIYWFRRSRFIAWGEIGEIKSGPNERIITITAHGGTKIKHSAFLSGRSRLLAELKRYCGDELPPDFPREPL